MSGQVICTAYLKTLSDAEIEAVLPLKDICVEEASRDFGVGGECRMVRFTAWRKAYPSRCFYGATKAQAIADLRWHDHNLAVNILLTRSVKGHEQKPGKKVKWWRKLGLFVNRKAVNKRINTDPSGTGL